MRRALLAAVAAAAVLASTSAGSEPSRSVLIIGDSVATGMLWHPSAIAVMQAGLEVDWQVAVCRTITGVSCPFEGERPSTVVELVHQLGQVPPVVVVEAGYNDPPATFPASVDDAMQALVDEGARHVLWLTLRASRGPFPELNSLLQQAAQRWPQLELVDWDRASSAHPDWFQTDGEHLLEPGGIAMAHLVHGEVMRIVDPLRVTTQQLALLGGRAYSIRLRAAGGAPPYAWRVASGRPPRGFHLLANGRLDVQSPRGAHSSMMLSVTDADGVTASLRVAMR
jgi:hypothetical protein